jgi:peptide chain release factor 1
MRRGRFHPEESIVFLANRTVPQAVQELRGLLDDPSTDPELRSLAQDDLAAANTSLSDVAVQLKRALIPQHPFATLPCLMEIRPGAGGNEAGIFAAEMLHMYLAFCSRRGLRASIIKKESEDAGAGAGSEDRISEAIVEIEDQGSYDILRPESGVHRVQRVPATESKGRTHTSAVSVMILPSFPSSAANDVHSFDDPTSDYYIDPQEVRVEKMRARGAGGQHVNKTESAIRLTHIPTGLAVSMQDSRSQHENRRKAWQFLRAKIAEIRREAREAELVRLRRGILGGVAKTDRGDKIRTYNFGQNRCTDHRSGCTIHNLADVLAGGPHLDKIMESARGWLIDQEVDTLYLEEELKSRNHGPKAGAKKKAS